MTKVIVIRGGGDLATGVAHAYRQSGLKVVILEIAAPSAIRRKVAFCEAVYENEMTIEGVTARRTGTAESAAALLSGGSDVIPLLVDPECRFLKSAAACGLEVTALVDAVLAKRNLGTDKSMAPVTIALGPGFTAGFDVDAVIETMRGHNLGRILFEGTAAANTGIPGIIAGFGKERVVHAPASGRIHLLHDIGDLVEKDEPIAEIKGKNETGTPVRATLTGVLRGIIHEGYEVTTGLKIADVDPRKDEQQNCFTISDKSRALGNAALRALIMCVRKKGGSLW
ncbi:MAG: EF2563 family selenium-dependent molybdenum hydroxylase system protein [Treponema sp.]|jgi:xanthine dehydrogenase accessory factor|nr:EF2563 family selenium-dependent molybdenum hydroxylase system protein [Treponema sp.]